MNCTVCETRLGFQWSDTHGVGVCLACGMPYRIFHYEGEERVEKPPEPALNDEGVTLARRYWAAKRRRVFPGCYDMGISGRRGTSYSGATQQDIEEFEDWYGGQPEVMALRESRLPANEAPSDGASLGEGVVPK